MTKEIITLITLGIGSILNIWVQGSIKITIKKRIDDPIYLHNRNMLIISAAIQTSLLVFAIVISVLKSWGKRKGKINSANL